MNCWEFKKCGREPGEAHEGKYGVCPAATNQSFNGCNGGLNAGRSCWMVAGTYCKGETQGTFIDKSAGCQKCDFYKLLESGGDGFFFLVKQDQVQLGDSRRIYEEKTISSKRDDEQTILYLLQQLRTKENSRIVTLMNIYKEIPISNNAEILEVRGSHILIATNELQIAVIKACGETFISTKHFPISILGRLEDYDIKRSTVTLNNLSYAELYTNHRNTVRVRLPRPLNVIMHADNNIISGAILDISHGGCGMNTLTTAGLESANGVSLKLKLLDPTTRQVIEADIPCVVVRIDNTRPPFKVALSFTHNQLTEVVVSRFIYQRQLEIVKELREAI